jgi:hypothetical protein
VVLADSHGFVVFLGILFAAKGLGLREIQWHE